MTPSTWNFESKWLRWSEIWTTRITFYGTCICPVRCIPYA